MISFQTSRRNTSMRLCSPCPSHARYPTENQVRLADVADSISSWRPYVLKSKQPIGSMLLETKGLATYSEKVQTLLFGVLPVARYTRLSSRCTSVSTSLSSNRLSSVSNVSIKANAALYECVSNCLSSERNQCASLNVHSRIVNAHPNQPRL